MRRRKPIPLDLEREVGDQAWALRFAAYAADFRAAMACQRALEAFEGLWGARRARTLKAIHRKVMGTEAWIQGR